MPRKKLKFIDLFAGLGGFHIALSDLGCECVFASELKDDLRKLYVNNFREMEGEIADGIHKVEGDITKVDLSKIPPHDILCAGFPCQPFSQAGKRQGFDDEAGRGNLFDYICKVISAQGDNKPKLLLLENVSNLKGHDNGNTWEVINQRLQDLDYVVKSDILSPHHFGIPQHRKRIYIVGIRKDVFDKHRLDSFAFPEKSKDILCDIHTIIDETDTSIHPLGLKTLHYLKVWQRFIDYSVERNGTVPSFPIWAMEFGADYPFIEKAPAKLARKNLWGHRGNLGIAINKRSFEDCIAQLPIYAQTNKAEQFPEWKIRYISQNREFYELNQDWINDWIDAIRDWDNSFQKMEWNCGKDTTFTLKDKIIQFRASGIRVKKATYSPALNLVGTQVPILPWIELPEQCIPEYSDEELAEYELTRKDIRFGRYLSVREAAKLQGMDRLDFGSLSTTRCYEALGNAINTQVVKLFAEQLIKDLE